MITGRSWLFLSSFVVLGLLVSCAPPAAPPPTPQPTAAAPKAETPDAKPSGSPGPPVATPKPAAEQPRYGGILTISASIDPVSFELHQEGNLGTLEPMVGAYDNLVEYELATGNIVGDLAEKWELSPDGLAYTFYLHKGVKFHDGRPLTAEDVRYNLERQKSPPRGVIPARKEQFDSVDRIEAPDDATVRIVMKQPYVAFMAQFATDWFAIMPKHVLEAKGDMKNEILGSGPFKFKSYSTGVAIELVKNPDYFVKGLPYLDGMTYYIIKDAGTRFSAFRTGRVRMTGRFAPLTPPETERIMAEYRTVSLWRFPGLQSPWHVINVTKPPLSDIRVRQAVSLAYDRQTAIRVLLGEGAAKIGTFLPPGPWGLTEAEVLKLPGYRQPKDADRAEAKRLLAEAGYADGFRMNLLVRTVRQDQKAGEYLKDQLATVGIIANIETAETAVYNTRTRSIDFQIGTQQNTWRVNDPDELSRKFLSGAVQNYGKWSVKRFDDLFLEQSRALDPTKRKALTRELDDILLQEWPSLWPYWADGVLATWPDVKNFATPPSFSVAMRNTGLWLAK